MDAWLVSKLSFGIELTNESIVNGICFQTLKHTSRGSKMLFLALFL